MKNVAKKHLGQHFLRDTGVLERILRLIQPSRNDIILEIGAGKGALSSLLAPRVSTLLAVEIDPDCLPSLEAALESCSGAVAVCDDLLRADVGSIIQPHFNANRQLRAVGNLPYNVATAIIERLLTSKLPFQDMVFLLQLEMAQRITASPGSRRYGFFSVFCQHLCDVRMDFKVLPGSFVPRPTVVSAMVVLKPRAGTRESQFEEAFLCLTKAAFAHRRKKLANSLKLHPGFKHITDTLCEVSGIDGSLRPEQLSVADFEQLALAYHNYLKRQSL
jgi:16S rRNA (adenine1518-N6/adenine1519-N6)-dimethyltransferase